MQPNHIHPFSYKVLLQELWNRLKADYRKYKGILKQKIILIHRKIGQNIEERLHF